MFARLVDWAPACMYGLVVFRFYIAFNIFWCVRRIWTSDGRARRVHSKVDVVTKNRKRNGYSMTTQIQYARILYGGWRLGSARRQSWHIGRRCACGERWQRGEKGEQMARIGGIILFVKYVLPLVDSSDCISVWRIHFWSFAVNVCMDVNVAAMGILDYAARRTESPSLTLTFVPFLRTQNSRYGWRQMQRTATTPWTPCHSLIRRVCECGCTTTYILLLWIH